MWGRDSGLPPPHMLIILETQEMGPASLPGGPPPLPHAPSDLRQSAGMKSH